MSHAPIVNGPSLAPGTVTVPLTSSEMSEACAPKGYSCICGYTIPHTEDCVASNTVRADKLSIITKMDQYCATSDSPHFGPTKPTA